jgi:basic membrane protein A
VDSVYLTGSTDVGIDLSGFNSPTLGFAAARYLSTQGADVLFHAAGRSGWGVFRYAAHQMTTFNENMWCVGVDVDQFAELGARGVEWGLDHDKVEAMRSQILTSIVWRLDYGIRDLVAQFLSTGKVESLKSTIDNRRVGYTTTGGNVDRWADSLDGVIAEVRAAKIVVDTVAAGPSPMLLDVMWC